MKPPYYPPGGMNEHARLEWLYWQQKTGNLSPAEKREMRDLERIVFATSQWDEEERRG